MTDIVITFKIPEELAHHAEQFGLLSRDRVIELLQSEIERRVAMAGHEPSPLLPAENDETVRRARLLLAQLPLVDDVDDEDDGISPSRKEIAAAIRASTERVASGKYPLRTLGLNKGTAWVSDDFDDPLPDEFWLGEDDPA